VADTGVRGAYRFGPFRLDVRERHLSRGAEPIPLRPKVFETVPRVGHRLTAQF
jgi:DNA-binding winged helix-turn-helix (wHTH) protein